MDRLQAMQVFVAVVERRSLSAAATSLGVSLPTVSRVLRSFERESMVRWLQFNELKPGSRVTFEVEKAGGVINVERLE